VVFFPGDADDALALLRALRANGVTAPFVGGDATEQMRQDADARGAYYGTFFRAEQATSAEGRWFVARYRARFQRDPDSFAALAYDATMVMGRTIVRGARTRAALRVALEQIGRSTPAVDGVVGPIAFDRAHDITGRHVVMVRVDTPADTGKASGAIPDGGAN
jgi:branched-chain amino acid transport system substrate-binding protein